MTCAGPADRTSRVTTMFGAIKRRWHLPIAGKLDCTMFSAIIRPRSPNYMFCAKSPDGSDEAAPGYFCGSDLYCACKIANA
jgi:hypothetical protein